MAQGGPGGSALLEAETLLPWPGGPWLRHLGRSRAGPQLSAASVQQQMAGLGAALCLLSPTLDEVEVNTVWMVDLPRLPRPNRNQPLLPLGQGLGLRLP